MRNKYVFVIPCSDVASHDLTPCCSSQMAPVYQTSQYDQHLPYGIPNHQYNFPCLVAPSYSSEVYRQSDIHQLTKVNLNQQAIPAAVDYNPSASANNQIVGTIPGITNVPQSAVRAQLQQQSMNSNYMQGLSTLRKDDQTVQRSGITDEASIRTKDEGERFITMLDSKQLARLRPPVQASYVAQYNNPATKWSNVSGEPPLRANDEYVVTLPESAQIFYMLIFPLCTLVSICSTRRLDHNHKGNILRGLI